MKLLSGAKLRSRRERVLKMLTSQLKKGVKPATKGRNGYLELMIPLTESDISRINKEIEIIKSRI